ncbi:mechanosensitive ion channel family protein, partial [bacterium]|nr:mechanosensitive ion channel family protein [bacterium]
MSETSAALKLPTQMLANQAAAIDSKVSNVAQDFSEWLGRQSWVPESLATLLLFVGMLALAAIIYFVF